MSSRIIMSVPVAIVLVLMGDVASAGSRLERPKDGRSLCSMHKKIGDATIVITTWASKASVASLVAAYEKPSSVKSVENPKLGGWTFQTEQITLTVMPAANVDRFPICASKPVASDQAVVLISKLVD